MAKDEVQDLLNEIEGEEPSAKDGKTAKPEPRAIEPVVLVTDVPVKKLKFNTENRKADEGRVNELAASITAFGLLVPITVNKKYEVLDGERRARACMQIGYETIPCIVVKNEFDETTLVANYIRENLSEDEVYEVVMRMHKKEGKTQEEIANRIGVSQPRVSQILGRKKTKPRKKKQAKKIKKAELPENVKMDVFKNRVEIKFILDAEMEKSPLKSITNLFKEIKDFKGIIEKERS